MSATSQPELKPLITDPTNAESMALKALAEGESLHDMVILPL
jgi:hypothetical protein